MHQDAVVIVIVIVVVEPNKLICSLAYFLEADYHYTTIFFTFFIFLYFIYKKVIYDVGTEILMPTSNLHNSTLRGPTEMILNADESSDRALSF